MIMQHNTMTCDVHYLYRRVERQASLVSACEPDSHGYHSEVDIIVSRPSKHNSDSAGFLQDTDDDADVVDGIWIISQAI